MSEDDKSAPEQPDSSGLPSLLKVSGAVVALLAGIHALTGWNPITLIHSEPPAEFVVDLPEFSGSPCHPGCSMHAILRNNGGQAGTATATFHVYGSDGALADCTAVIPKTPQDALVNVGCTAYSPDLDGYWKEHPHGKVSMYVTVHNPT